MGPPHRECQGESNKGVFVAVVWDGHGEFGYVLEAEPHTVKTVDDVQFEEVDGAMARIAVDNLVEDLVQGVALGGERGSVSRLTSEKL